MKIFCSIFFIKIFNFFFEFIPSNFYFVVSTRGLKFIENDQKNVNWNKKSIYIKSDFIFDQTIEFRIWKAITLNRSYLRKLKSIKTKLRTARTANLFFCTTQKSFFSELMIFHCDNILAVKHVWFEVVNKYDMTHPRPYSDV